MRLIAFPVVAAALLSYQSAAAQPEFLKQADPAQQIAEACGSIDVADAGAVYDCLALRPRNAALAGMRPTDDCQKVVDQLAFMVREAGKTGAAVTTDPAALPCESAAQVIYDASGTEPYWTACMGYDPASKVEHFGSCVIAYYMGRTRRSEEVAVETFQGAGCDELKSIYYNGAMPDAYKEMVWPDGQIRNLPENIEDIDCTDIATISFN
ncbi:hypothetical protein OCH239_10905 [Roseivivax halodurans JCM 10272]|uniref:YARHG domain-containing protein n=1 Tax=Roseivivax halodurans JCM 10272 TaxID=1449350 RepID=X7EB85_9RHOB|nr:hypothetical protein [Roseivivax halodurans]ETX13344.1 hypothetical protein OCH239_10905 [Roseivivax halodurans JCM 10272]